MPKKAMLSAQMAMDGLEVFAHRSTVHRPKEGERQGGAGRSRSKTATSEEVGRCRDIFGPSGELGASQDFRD
jgi:hypothetical protein